MKIIWSEFASSSLKEIYLYHRDAAGLIIAKKLRDKIFDTTRQLIKHPDSGTIEQTLLPLKEGHR
jgi:plasmid stabilization system protein ParE